jgi:hypothetical protein
MKRGDGVGFPDPTKTHTAYVAGWGRRENHEEAIALQWTSLTIEPSRSCNKMGINITLDQICASKFTILKICFIFELKKRIFFFYSKVTLAGGVVKETETSAQHVRATRVEQCTRRHW